MRSELKPCPFCSEQCATLVIDQGDKWAHYEPSCLEVRTGYDLSDDAAWRAEAITAWNARASDAEITRLTEALRAAEEQVKGLREVAIKLHGALAAHTCEGCPRCPGDCAGANPPMMDCPTQRAIEAYRAFDAALKGPSHDA